MTKTGLFMRRGFENAHFKEVMAVSQMHAAG
jgi:hypothetical protein